MYKEEQVLQKREETKMSDTAKVVMMKYSGHQGYGADQIENPMTLGEILEEIQDAITEWGEDAVVVPFETNNGRGASYGKFYKYELFELDGEEY